MNTEAIVLIVFGILFAFILIDYVARRFGAYIKGFVKGLLAFAKAPVKFVKTRKAAKLVKAKTKLQAKLDEALLIAKKEADLNAARQNPNFANHPKVKEVLRKIEDLDAK